MFTGVSHPDAYSLLPTAFPFYLLYFIKLFRFFQKFSHLALFDCQNECIILSMYKSDYYFARAYRRKSRFNNVYQFYPLEKE